MNTIDNPPAASITVAIDHIAADPRAKFRIKRDTLADFRRGLAILRPDRPGWAILQPNRFGPGPKAKRNRPNFETRLARLSTELRLARTTRRRGR